MNRLSTISKEEVHALYLLRTGQWRPMPVRPLHCAVGSIVVAISAASSLSTCATARASCRCSSIRTKPDAFALASELRGEFCIQVTGVVRPVLSPSATATWPLVPSEVFARKLTIINRAEAAAAGLQPGQQRRGEPPEYRYLDLRRPRWPKYLKTRAKASALLCAASWTSTASSTSRDPMLTKADRRAADYLVPSRVHRGQVLRPAAVPSCSSGC